MIEADDVRVCGIHPLVAEEYEMHGITTMDSDWWATRTQRDIDKMCEEKQAAYIARYEQFLERERELQCAAEPTAEVSAVHPWHRDPVEKAYWQAFGEDYQRECEQETAKMRRATEDDYFAEMFRMGEKIALLEQEKSLVGETIAELSRRPTLEQYLAVCESAARITKAFEMMADTAKQLQAEYDALSGRVLATKPMPKAFPANALRHSV